MFSTTSKISVRSRSRYLVCYLHTALAVFACPAAGHASTTDAAQNAECSTEILSQSMNYGSYNDWPVSISEIAHLWQTPILNCSTAREFPVGDLLRLVTKTKEKDVGVQKSNKRSGSYHSKNLIEPGYLHALHAEDSWVNNEGLKSLYSLVDLIVNVTTELVPRADPETVFIQNLWSVGNIEGQYNVIHTHPNALASGVLYLDSGGASHGGELQFFDPRPLLTCSKASSETLQDLFMLCSWCPNGTCENTKLQWLSGENWHYEFPPVRGHLYMWPAFVPHGVLPCRGVRRPRMAISFNVYAVARQEHRRALTLPPIERIHQRESFLKFMQERPIFKPVNDNFVREISIRHLFQTSIAEFSSQPSVSKLRFPTPVTCVGTCLLDATMIGEGTLELFRNLLVSSISKTKQFFHVETTSANHLHIIAWNTKTGMKQTRLNSPHGVKSNLFAMYVLLLGDDGKVLDSKSSILSLSHPDPRPEAKNDIKILDGGTVLRWGGKSKEGLVAPAWITEMSTISASSMNTGTMAILAYIYD